MTLCRAVHDKKNPYVILNTTIAKDERLSWKAKGIWFYAFSNRDDWKFNEKDLIRQSQGSRDAFRTGLRELEKYGYFFRFQKRNAQGQLCACEWIFFETPKTKEELKEIILTTEKPLTDCSLTENQPLTNNKSKQVIKEQQRLEVEKTLNDGTVQFSVVVFPFLKEINGLSEGAARKLMKIYSEGELEAAVNLMKKSKKTIRNPFGWLCSCIEDGYEEPVTEEQIEKDNKKVLIECFRGLDGKTVGGHTILVGPTYIEFYRGGASNIQKTFTTGDPYFELNVRKFLRILQSSEKNE